ncbi:hypothetical protein Tco_1155881 [Tanacetum coccineum]
MYKSGDTERTLDLRQLNRTVIQCTITPRTLNFEDEKTGALDTTNDDGGCLRRFKAEWDAEKKRKKFEELRSKAKTTLRLYDKVRRSIKAPQDFIPMGSRTEKVVGLFVSVARKKMQRDFKKRKLTMYEEQPFKKLSCRTEELYQRMTSPKGEWLLGKGSLKSIHVVIDNVAVKDNMFDAKDKECSRSVYQDGCIQTDFYACSDSLLLTLLCCDDIHDVTPRVSALAGCDRLVSEPLVIENCVMNSYEVSMFPLLNLPLADYPREPVIDIITHYGVFLLRRVESRIRLCTHAKRQGRERDSKNAVWLGPTNGKEGRGERIRRTMTLEICMVAMYEKDIATYVSNCLTCLKVNAETSKTFRFIITTKDFITRFPRSSSGYDTNWVIVDRLTKVFDVLYLKRCMEGSVGHMFFRLKLEKFGRLDRNWYKRQQIRVEVGDKVMLEVSLRLPKELSEVHDTFHVSNLKKCLADANLHVPLEEIKVDKTLHFVEEPVEIIDREVKSLKRSRVPIVKYIGTRSEVMRIS